MVQSALMVAGTDCSIVNRVDMEKNLSERYGGRVSDPRIHLTSMSNKIRLAEHHRPELEVENLDAEERIHGDQVTLLVAVIGHDDTHREAVVAGDTSTSPDARHRESERAIHQRDGVAVESEVVGTGGAEVDVGFVRNRLGESTVEEDAGNTSRDAVGIHVDDGVDRAAGREAKGNSLADLRVRGRTVVADVLVVPDRVGRARVDEGRSVQGDDRLINQSDLDRAINLDDGRSTGTSRTDDAKRGVITGKGDPRSDRDGSGQVVHGHAGDASGLVAVDGTGHDGVADGDVGLILSHEDVEAELAAERRLTESRPIVTDAVSLQERLILEQGGLADRRENQVTPVLVRLVDIEHLPRVEQVAFRGRLAQGTQATAVVGDELVNLTTNHHVDLASDREHGRVEVLDDEVLERLALVGILDDERSVDVLVKNHRDIGRGVGLHGHGVSSRLTDGLELARLAGVHGVAVACDHVLEVTVDEVTDHHVLFEDGDRFVGPQFRGESRREIVVDGPERIGNQEVEQSLHWSLCLSTEMLRLDCKIKTKCQRFGTPILSRLAFRHSR